MADLDSDLSSGEAQFLDQYTRKCMVDWCLYQMTTTGPPPTLTSENKVFGDHARSKGWISKKDGKVLAGGWKVAAAFLKR